MVNYCCVPGCNTHGGFKFPSDAYLRLQWAQAIKREGPNNQLWMPSSNSVVCDWHFNSTDFVKFSVEKFEVRRRKLIPGSIPTIFGKTKERKEDECTQGKFKIILAVIN